MGARLALLLVAFSAAAPAQELGTLFHSPKEREALERMRRGETVEQTLVPLPDPVVTGFVKRSDGKSTVFIDKRPYPARDPRMQGVLEPKIVERYEPVPLPPPPAPAEMEKAGNGGASEASKKDAPRRPPAGKED
ncbi:MAG: hypothetical protein KIS74_12620 [Burkholderiales bacterium]|nr:hypothetical protein [Burkholderiales bacterium]